MARSDALMPVVTPRRPSIASVKAVPWTEVLIGDMSGRWSSSQRSSVSGIQMRPRAYFAMKLMASGVIFSAAIVRSPSFSRSSSSTRTITRPWRMSSTASSTVANRGWSGMARLGYQGVRSGVDSGGRIRQPFAWRGLARSSSAGITKIADSRGVPVGGVLPCQVPDATRCGTPLPCGFGAIFVNVAQSAHKSAELGFEPREGTGNRAQGRRLVANRLARCGHQIAVRAVTKILRGSFCCCYYWLAAGHCLEQRHAKSFTPIRQDKGIHSTIKVGKSRVIDRFEDRKDVRMHWVGCGGLDFSEPGVVLIGGG